MQSKCNTKIEINKVGIEFTDKKITAYGGFSLMALFFEKIKLRENLEKTIPIKELSPNAMSIYSKILSYMLMIYAGGSRFSHLLYLGCQEVLSELFTAGRLPLASTTLTRLFRKIKSLKGVEELSEGLLQYLEKLIPWRKLREDWLTFDSTVLERYGKQEGVKRGYNPKKKGRGSHSPLMAFLNRSKYVINLWNRPGNVATWNNILGFFEATWQRINSHIDIYEILGQKEKIERLKTLRYKYYVLPAQLGSDGRKQILRISIIKQKIRSKLIYLYNRIKQYFPYGNDNCNAVA